MFKYAGVVLDWHDDQGETFKAVLEKHPDAPEWVKTASILPREQLTPEDFALHLLDRGYSYHKYACYDPTSTMLSCIYFEKHGSKLPLEARKTAAVRLVDACTRFGHRPPSALKKLASLEATSERPLVKTALPQQDGDYAVVTEQGRFYPIDSWDRVKVAERYFLEEGVRMAPHTRRQYAEKLAAKATEIGFPLNEKVAEHGSKTWAPADNVEASICARKTASDENGRAFLDELFEKRASIGPELYAECLRHYDVDHGLDSLWGRTIPDPWESTFGIDKTAEVIWESGTERLTDSQLFNLAKNGIETFIQQFSDHAASDFAKDPRGIFDSMPEPQKKLIARMAADVASSGNSAVNVIG